MRAIPSPICRTVPTSARSVSTSYCSIRWRRIDVISSGRSFKSLSAPHQCLSKSFQSPAHARVGAIRACLQHDAAENLRVDAARRLHAATGSALDLLDDLLRLVVRQLPRRRQLDRQAPLLDRDQPFELARDVIELARAPLLGDHEQEVLEERLLVAGDVREDARLRVRVELRVPQDRAQLRRLLERRGEVRERLADLLEAPFLFCGLEKRLRVDALRGGYRSSSRREKSSDPMACVISSRSRSESSFCPTT